MKYLACLLLIVSITVLQAQDSATIYYRLADTQYKNKQGTEAKVSIEKSIHFHATDSAYLLRATMQGETHKALADLDTAIILNANFTPAYLMRGTSYLNENFEKSLQDFLQVVKLWPDSVVGYEWLGLLYWEYEYYKEAIENYSKAIELSPEKGALYENRARVKMAAKEYTAAIEDFNKAITHNSSNKQEDIIRVRGICKHYLGDKDGCCEDLNTAINLGSRGAGSDYKELCK